MTAYHRLHAAADRALMMLGADLTPIGAALGKRHGDQQTTLQFTRRNWWTIRDDPDRFRNPGPQVWLPSLIGQPG